MANTHPVIVHKYYTNQPPDSLLSSSEELLFTLSDGHHRILDQPGDPHREATHRLYNFADLVTDASARDLYVRINLKNATNPPPIIGTFTNIRSITAQELYTMTRPSDEFFTRKRINRPPAYTYRDIPASMRTYEFLEWLQTAYPADGNPEPKDALIMNGAQFNHHFPGQKITFVNPAMICNGYQWQLGENIHPTFSAITEYAHGLHFVEAADKDAWQEHYDKANRFEHRYTDQVANRMTYTDNQKKLLVVTVPDDAIITFERDHGNNRDSTRYKASKLYLSLI